MRPGIPLDELSEKEWAAQVSDLARTTGWRRYHTFRSTKSAAGFPDEVLVRERVVYLELKSESGRLSDQQRDWLTALRNAGAEAYIARPSDLKAVADVLTARGRVHDRLELRTTAELNVQEKAA